MKRRPRGRIRKKHRSYNIIPLSALLIFALCMVVAKTPVGAFVDNFTPINLFKSATSGNALPLNPDNPKDIPETGLPTESVPPPKSVIKDISIKGTDEATGNVFVQNLTKLEVNTEKLLNGKIPVSLTQKGVQVLIVHTHGSESYTPDPDESYPLTDNDRTTDNHYNVVRVGQEITDVLNNQGISTLHLTALHDTPTYNGSYTRSLDAITQAIKNNPSIKVIIDVHRDSMISKEGVKYKVTSDINGKPAAQLMFVTGSSAGGLVHDNWQKNLTFQMKIQQKMNAKYPGIMRPIIVRESRFNQHVSPGSMLLEVGTSGNSLKEALYSAKLFADNLADMLK